MTSKLDRVKPLHVDLVAEAKHHGQEHGQRGEQDQDHGPAAPQQLPEGDPRNLRHCRIELNGPFPLIGAPGSPKTLSSDSSAETTSNSRTPAALLAPAISRRNAPSWAVWTESPACVNSTAKTAGFGHQGSGQSPIVAGANGDVVRPVGHEGADGPEVARGSQSTGDHDQYLGADPLDLLEDVRREQDRPTRHGQLPRRSIMAMRWRGSMPLNGSSRRSTWGSWTSEPATLTRCRMPLE